MVANTRERSVARRWSWSDLVRFLRFEYLPFALTLPLIGAASVSAQLTLLQMIGLLGVAAALHVFISIENDIIDLPLDRTHPERANYPLVKGTIRPGQALAIALIQIPIALALTLLLGGKLWAYAAIGLSVAIMTIYNVWGKRAPFPPLTDMVQGIGFGVISLYGAAAIGDMTPLTFVVFVSVVAWMMLTNLFGGLRDLASDFDHGARTTPIQFGARPAGDSQTHPRSMQVYAYLWSWAMIGLALLALILNPFGYAPVARLIVTAAIVLLGLVSLRLLAAFFEAAFCYPTMIAVGRLQMLSSSTAILVLFGPRLDVGFLIVLVIVFALGMWGYDARPALRFLRRRIA